MTDHYLPTIGLEVHAELSTRSKMFCSCPVVDSNQAPPNSAVCPVCAGMPGTLPVANQQAVEYALRVALALECEIAATSVFARKNYFYPDLPKGYQISQYEQPLARNGRLSIQTAQGERFIRIHRVHLEEDTGKLAHIQQDGKSYSLVDLNRAGVPLLEIVSEPDLHSLQEVRAYAEGLRRLLCYLDVNSGDLEKGILRIEPNVSVREKGASELGTRTEIKNLNSLRALERSVAYEIQRQSDLLQRGEKVLQETLGWDERAGVTISQRSKEEAHDYRYFPEPDLPPLVVNVDWVDEVRRSLPELPQARLRRFITQYGLSPYDANLLVEEPAVALFFEATLAEILVSGQSQEEASRSSVISQDPHPQPLSQKEREEEPPTNQLINSSQREASRSTNQPSSFSNQHSAISNPKLVANWITGELFGLLKTHRQKGEGGSPQDCGFQPSSFRLHPSSFPITPAMLAELLQILARGEINALTAKDVLAEMVSSGRSPREIIKQRSLGQVSDPERIAALVRRVLEEHPAEVSSYQKGKTTVSRWLFGQVMQATSGQADPRVVGAELEKQLKALNQ